MTMKTSDGKMVKIIESVAPQWKQIGAHLDFDSKGHILKLLEADHQQKGHVECCQEMFIYWLNCRNATWEALVEVLKDADQSELATQITSVLFS